MAFSNVSSGLQVVSSGFQVVDSAYNLPGMVTNVIRLIRNIVGNEEHGLRLRNLADQLRENLDGIPTASLNLTQKELQSVIQILESIGHGRHGDGFLDGIQRVFTAPDEHSKLEQVERKLESLMTQVVVALVGNTVRDVVPTICNDSVELPSSQVGLDRATAALAFLERSRGQGFRVIAIHGQPGVGKTTLLNSIWETVSSENPFQAKAYVQIGHDATDFTICDSQSSICSQLGATSKKFPTPAFGRKELSKHFQQLETQKKPLFIAIDNVFKVQDLQSLLPSEVRRANLPTSSCIALTCRNYRIVKALLRICGLQENDHSHVFKLEPRCLSDEESRRVFVECAGMDPSALEQHKELLDALVPLCGGLPLALTVLGTIFREEAKRENEQWREIQDQWGSFNDLDDEDSALVIKAVRLSFEMLGESHQQAFLDMVSTFYGWKWDHVESVVGESVMSALKNSGLVWKVEHIWNCNQGALREGRELVEEDLGLDKWFDTGSGIVSMHDLTLRFGERTIGHNKPLVILRSASGNDSLDVSKLRHLIISNQPLRFYDEGFVQSLQNAKCLQSLVLCQGFRSLNPWRILLKVPLIRATYCDKIADLHSLNLYGLNSSQRIMRMVQVSRLRVLILWGCSDLVQLPAKTPLHYLEYLRIRSCPLFQGFSASCLQAWCRLKVLELIGCPKITTLPAELGALPSKLAKLKISECHGLVEFLPTRNSTQHFALTSVVIDSCKKLVKLPAALVNIAASLAITDCDELMELPPDGEVSNMTALELRVRWERLPAERLSMFASLTRLSLRQCNNLMELPHQIGGLCSLKELHLSGGKKLGRLPDSLGSLTSLERLALWGCESLIELPQQIGELCFLKKLHLKDCKKLERLPDSLGSLTSLEKLDLGGCESLIELPQQIGGLCSLKELELNDGKKLERLPDSLGSLTSLEELALRGCESLIELPQQIGELCSLKKLHLKDCKKLERLPDSLGSLTSLEKLDLGGCESLIELPQEIEGLCSLKKLHLKDCKKLERLPDSLGSLTSLEKLDLGGCESLIELPQQIGELCSLKKLVLNDGEKLGRLPDSLGSLTSLECLALRGCESLIELPQQIGELCSLKQLWLHDCKKLERLPDSVGSLTSLEELALRGCKSLIELPQQIGDLCSLKKLELHDCEKLERLPDSLGSLTSLEELDLGGCESLIELPQQIGELCSLKKLVLNDGEKLGRLPDSLGSLTSLEKLDLGGCKSLIELRQQIGELCSLKELELNDGKKLERLPDSVGSLTSLERLALWGCESLIELPQQIGELCSLKELELNGEKLERLPDSVGSLTSLERLALWGCESLIELPQQIGELCSLKQLWLSLGKKLERLPDSVGSLTSLEHLALGGCEILIELPQQIGELCSLKRLWLHDCKKLERLPDSVGSLTSLEELALRGCESLIELPQQIGELCSLKELRLSHCKKLERVPDFLGILTSLEKLEL